MYLYKVGYHSCEDSNYQEYFHKKKYTEKQLKVLISKALVNASGLVIQDKIDFCKTLSEKRLEIKYLNQLTFSDIISQSIGSENRFKEEFTKLGFKPVEYQSSYSIFGWSGIFSDCFSSENDKFQNEIKARIKKQIAKIHPKIWKMILKFQNKEKLKYKK
jgi:hypothetical protein